MKPVEREGYVGVWVLMEQSSDGKFFIVAHPTTDFGPGFHKSEKDAQHYQTMEMLKGHICNVYHLEWPL